MFKTYKQYENGGEVLVPKTINKRTSDYKQLISIANFFAKEGKSVRLNPVVHFKSDEYKEIYKSLAGTFILRSIRERMEDEKFKYDIEEVWLYEKGNVRLLFKIQ